jgi:CheY-like chemotaxis protein
VTTKLLAVDDSKTLRKVLEITFAGENFQTDLAGNADEALARLRSNRPRVALVDASLAGASGYDLCQQIKNEAPDVAVLILSSKHRPYDQGRGAQVGADDFMDKPFDTQKLIDKVNALAAQAAARPAAVAPAPVAPAPAPVVSPAPAFAAPRSAAPVPQVRPAVSAAPAPVAPRPVVSAAPVAPAAARPAAPAPRPVVSAAPVAPIAAAPIAPEPAVAAPARSVATPVAAAVGADFSAQLQGLGLSAQQVEGVLALSRDVVERVVWEVVPVLAETLIKEELARLTAE